MRIGEDDNYLSIELTPLEGGYAAFRFEAVSFTSDGKFAATQEGVMMDTSAKTASRFADFADLKSNKFEIPLTVDGWLRFERDAKGYIAVHYRIEGRKVFTPMAMEGKVVVEGEFAGKFCQEFAGFLNGNRVL